MMVLWLTLDSLVASKYETKNNNSKDLHSTIIYQSLVKLLSINLFK